MKDWNGMNQWINVWINKMDVWMSIYQKFKAKSFCDKKKKNNKKEWRTKEDEREKIKWKTNERRIK